MISILRKLSALSANTTHHSARLLFAVTMLFSTGNAFAQAELMPWGNLTGIRIKGQLMDFNTNLSVVGEGGWSHVKFSGKELQKPKFDRNGAVQTVHTVVDGIDFTETVTDVSPGVAQVTVKAVSNKDINLTGVFIGVTWNKLYYTGRNSFQIMPLDFAKTIEHNDSTQAFLPIHTGLFKKDIVYEKTFTIRVSGEIDNTAAEIDLDASTKGQPFAGVGGNFRLQNAKLDPQVIDYCLANMRVAWGRVEMPWRNWQKALDVDPTVAAKNGKLDPHVEKSMQMAQRLAKMNIPIIVSAWSAPDWAIIGKPHNGPTPAGIWGNPLNQDNIQQIYKSITDYLLYLKNNYNSEATFFSFNESDLGINVRQTGAEHAQLIKGLGAYFKSKGLKTKLLLGDNSDANTYAFIYPALNDPECTPYIGAISFHSWRGWETETLQKWAAAAKKIDVSLLVGEGSIDAAAWQYPAYFEEQSYALEEINLYVRMLAICQPLSILQWQLTADYSPLTGGGIFGNTGSLTSTQRFWQLKQLAATKANERHIIATSSRPDISAAGLVSAGNTYTIHLVNNSAGREVTVKGLPKTLTKLKIFLTDKTRDMEALKDIMVKNGQAVFYLDPRCFVTLVN